MPISHHLLPKAREGFGLSVGYAIGQSAGVDPCKRTASHYAALRLIGVGGQCHRVFTRTNHTTLDFLDAIIDKSC